MFSNLKLCGHNRSIQMALFVRHLLLLTSQITLAIINTRQHHGQNQPHPLFSLDKARQAMKIGMTSQPKGHPWLLVFTMLLAIFVMLCEGATSFSPPSLSLSPTYAPVVKVIGKVYCYRCFNEANPEESHGKKHLEGAMVKVTCQANDQALVGFGYTKNNGKYSVTLKGLPISNNYGADSCKVELHAAPGGSQCNVPIELNLSGLSIYSKSNEGVVLKANQILAFASKKPSGCSKPHVGPPMHPHNSPPVPYHYPSPPFSYKSPPLPYQYSPPPSNQFPPQVHQFPPPPQSYYLSPPPYHQSTPPNSYSSPPQSYNYPPPPQGLRSPTPAQKFFPPPYYYNTPPPQHHYSPPPNSYVSPPVVNQYPPPPYKSPVLPSSPAAPHHYNSPPPYQYPPPLYSYQSLPPPAQYSPPLAPVVSQHLQPKVPHAKSTPVSAASPQPLYQYNSPPPEENGMGSPCLHGQRSPRRLFRRRRRSGSAPLRPSKQSTAAAAGDLPNKTST